MDRINGHDWVDIGGGRHGFRGEDLTNGITGTEITDVWLNTVQEEIANVIEAAGIVLNPADNAQLLKALEAIVTRRGQPWIPVLSLTTTAPPGSPAVGDAYIIPNAATGAWAGRSQQLATWSGSAWVFTNTKNGHGVGAPDGSAWMKVDGVYVILPLSPFATVEETLEGVSEVLKTHPKGVMAAIRAAIAGLGSYVTINFNADLGKEYWVDTTAGLITGQLPADPPEGARIFIGRKGANFLDVYPDDDDTIENRPGPLRFNRNNRGCHLVFVGGTWRARGEIIAK